MTETPELEHGDGHDVSPVGDIHSFPSDAELSRSLIASSTTGVLSTLTSEGSTYGSLVSHIVADHGNPVILISDLAEHTKMPASTSEPAFWLIHLTSLKGIPLLTQD